MDKEKVNLSRSLSELLSDRTRASGEIESMQRREGRRRR
jgi:hypothetical protein